MTAPRFGIGTTFRKRNKRADLCTVTDILTTTDHAGKVVSIRYIAVHDFLGQLVADYDVCETTIAIGLIEGVAP